MDLAVATGAFGHVSRTLLRRIQSGVDVLVLGMAAKAENSLVGLEQVIGHRSFCVVAEQAVFPDRFVLVEERPLLVGVAAEAEIVNIICTQHHLLAAVRIVAVVAGHLALTQRVVAGHLEQRLLIGVAACAQLGLTEDIPALKWGLDVVALDAQHSTLRVRRGRPAHGLAADVATHACGVDIALGRIALEAVGYRSLALAVAVYGAGPVARLTHPVGIQLVNAQAAMGSFCHCGYHVAVAVSAGGGAYFSRFFLILMRQGQAGQSKRGQGQAS